MNLENIVIPELEKDVIIKENESGETFSIQALINVIIAFINKL